MDGENKGGEEMKDALVPASLVFGLCCSVSGMSKPGEASGLADDQEPYLGRLGAIPAGGSREQPDPPTWSVDVTFISPNVGGHSEERRIC